MDSTRPRNPGSVRMADFPEYTNQELIENLRFYRARWLFSIIWSAVLLLFCLILMVLYPDIPVIQITGRVDNFVLENRLLLLFSAIFLSTGSLLIGSLRYLYLSQLVRKLEALDGR